MNKSRNKNSKWIWTSSGIALLMMIFLAGCGVLQPAVAPVEAEPDAVGKGDHRRQGHGREAAEQRDVDGVEDLGIAPGNERRRLQEAVEQELHAGPLLPCDRPCDRYGSVL